MSGFITIERKLWDHPLFTPAPMTEREAWMWMIAQAAWSETQHRVGCDMVPVPRGSFMATLREMQAAFIWGSDKRVRTFLKTLEKNAMIGRTVHGSKNAPKTQVTICNYDEYQSSGRAKDAPKTQGRTHRGRTADAVKNKGTREQVEDTNVSLSEFPPAIDAVSEAVSAYNLSADRAGWPKVQKLSTSRRAAIKARLKDCGGSEGWLIAMAKAEASPFLTGQTSRPFLASFDFLTKQANFTKLMEGNYDDRTNNSQDAQRPDALADEILAAARAR